MLARFAAVAILISHFSFVLPQANAGPITFWVDSFPKFGVFRAGTDEFSTEGTNIVSDDIGTPLGLAVDFVNQRLYWTDFTKGTLESADLDGSNRSVILPALFNPRSLAVDPISGKLAWIRDVPGDIPRKEIQISNLDGSGLSTAFGTSEGLHDLEIGSVVPEPTSLTLLGIGAASLFGYGLRRKRTAVV